MKKNIRTALFWVFVLCGGLWLLNALFMPKYMSDIPEGALIAEYYKEETGHDVVFIGDCEVYENFSPDLLWREYGVTSYIRGSAQQLIWQSYYLMEETLNYETPKVMVFNVLSMKYGEPQSEAYNRLNLDGMRLSPQKLAAVRASMTEEESLLSYLFPLLRYHSRWNELKGEDLRYLTHRDIVSDSGYLMNVQVRPAENVPAGRPLGDYSFAPVCWDYLDKMASLCEEKGVRLVLIKAPSLYPFWYDQWEEQIEDYAARRGLSYINFLELTDEIGVDFTTDTYDSGLHLNLYGAEKLSRWFAQRLTAHRPGEDRRGQEEYADIWNEKSAAYAARRERLEAEWSGENPA